MTKTIKVRNWVASLLDFNLTVEWIPGKQNFRADALSRLVEQISLGISSSAYNVSEAIVETIKLVPKKRQARPLKKMQEQLM